MKSSVLQLEDSVRELGKSIDYEGTVQFIERQFVWRPGLVTRVLAGVMKRVVLPFEEGSYHGRKLPGEPHRASWVIAGPLTVFLFEEATYRRKLMLLARLRCPAQLNLIEIGSERQAQRHGPGNESKDINFRSRGFDESSLFSGSPLEVLVDLQKKSVSNITVVPVVHTSYHIPKSAPPLSLNARLEPFKPLNLFRRMTSMWWTLRTGSLKNTRIIPLKNWIDGRSKDGEATLVDELIRDASIMMEAERRAVEGPPREPLWLVKQRVLSDPLLSSYMQDYALNRGLSQDVVLKEAQGYIGEIASDNRIGVVRWFARAMDYVFERLLEKIDVDRWGIRFLRECDQRERIVLVCSHKSYLDPLLVGYVMFRSGLNTPEQAAGLNLNFWPVGWLLRHSGAFYLRRTFSRETLYKQVFSAYVRYLLAMNYISVLYIEGTRSRDGKLSKPKIGYLKILEEALKMGICSDIKLVPVYLGYDKVAEESAHVKEMSGSKKLSESVRGFAGIYRSVSTTLGRALVKFSKPLSMKELLERRGLEGTAKIVARAIDNVTPVTARSLVAASILSSGEEWVSRESVARDTNLLFDFARSSCLPLIDDSDDISGAITWFEREGRITLEKRGETEGFRVDSISRRYLEYNKNISIGHFLESAFASFSFIRRGREFGEIMDDTCFLKEVLSEEFVYRSDEEWEKRIESALDGINGKSHPVDLLSSLAQSFVEGYYVAILAASSVGNDQTFDQDAFSGNCFREGESLISAGVIRKPESLSRVIFKNAITLFSKYGVLESVRDMDGRGKEFQTISRGDNFDKIKEWKERMSVFFAADDLRRGK
ncbi:MAG: 1-acyl-sn-glycerol-3-phosphate acyltransferase [Actinomycetota bacterium]|nr:1-acyl-sn-glycerol-3-phosphate acyltransferase [Actinomycetota bacterium]